MQPSRSRRCPQAHRSPAPRLVPAPTTYSRLEISAQPVPPGRLAARCCPSLWMQFSIPPAGAEVRRSDCRGRPAGAIERRDRAADRRLWRAASIASMLATDRMAARTSLGRDRGLSMASRPRNPLSRIARPGSPRRLRPPAYHAPSQAAWLAQEEPGEHGGGQRRFGMRPPARPVRARAPRGHGVSAEEAAAVIAVLGLRAACSRPVAMSRSRV